MEAIKRSILSKKFKKIIISIIITLFCVFSVRGNIAAEAAFKYDNVRLIPVGAAISINVEADGVLVVGMSEVETAGGMKAPAFDAGLREGDFITHVGKDKVTCADEFRQAVNRAKEQVSVRFVRAGKQLQVTLKPELNGEGVKEIGIWLRSGMAGIGTMTFIDPSSGLFGALGHSVSDIDTGIILPIKKGEICRTEVSSVIKGETGKPGELKGNIRFDKGEGKITINTPRGIFGYADKKRFGGNAMEIIPCGELKCGDAQIIADVGEGVKNYGVEISRVYHESGGARDMLITVSDTRLTKLSGGIVQGMSGSPIIQNGRLAGAVTHVLVGDPKKGYAISIEHMLDAAYGAQKPAPLHTKSSATYHYFK